MCNYLCSKEHTTHTSTARKVTEDLLYHAIGAVQKIINPLSPTSDRISPYYQYNIKQTSNENKEKYQLGDYWLIQF